MASPTIKAKFDLDGSGFKKTMADIQTTAKKSVKEIEGLGGSGGGGLLVRALGVVGALVGIKQIENAIDAVIAKMKKLRDDSNQTGLDAETLQKAGNLGNVEHVIKGLESLAEAQAKILSGGDGDLKLTKAFAGLGVSLDDLKSKKHQQIFFEIAESMKKAEASAENINNLSEVMGGKGPDLLPMFRKGFDSAEANAGVISNDEVAELNRLSDEAAKSTAPIKTFWEQVKTDAAAFFIKAKAGMADLVTDLPEILSMKTASVDEARGERIRSQGAERLRMRDVERAKMQVAAEEARIAKEEADAKRAELMRKALQVQGREREKGLQEHIRGLQGAGVKVSDDLIKLRSGDTPKLQISEGGSAMSEGELVRLSQAIVHELQKANEQLRDVRMQNGRGSTDF